MGKSRLIAELMEVVAQAPVAGQPGPLWLEGRCLDVGMTVSYWPFLDVLRTYIGLGPEDDESARGVHISAALESLVAQGALTPDRRDEMLPVLGHLLAAQVGSDRDDRLRAMRPEQLKHQNFLCLRDLLVALAHAQPVVLILEDLHWADSLSLDVIALLMETLTLAPLFVVASTALNGNTSAGTWPASRSASVPTA